MEYEHERGQGLSVEPSRSIVSSCPSCSLIFQLLCTSRDYEQWHHLQSHQGWQLQWQAIPDWLEGLLEVMNLYPAPHSILVLDNCCIWRKCAKNGNIIPLFSWCIIHNYPQRHQACLSTPILTQFEPHWRVFLLCQTLYLSTWGSILQHCQDRWWDRALCILVWCFRSSQCWFVESMVLSFGLHVGHSHNTVIIDKVHEKRIAGVLVL